MVISIGSRKVEISNINFGTFSTPSWYRFALLAPLPIIASIDRYQEGQKVCEEHEVVFERGWWSGGALYTRGLQEYDQSTDDLFTPEWHFHNRVDFVK